MSTYQPVLSVGGDLNLDHTPNVSIALERALHLGILHSSSGLRKLTKAALLKEVARNICRPGAKLISRHFHTDLLFRVYSTPFIAAEKTAAAFAMLNVSGDRS